MEEMEPAYAVRPFGAQAASVIATNVPVATSDGTCAPDTTSANGIVVAQANASQPDRHAAATAPASMSARIVCPLGSEVSNAETW